MRHDEDEDEQTCAYCGKPGYLIKFLDGDRYHVPCLEEFKKTEDGKWYIEDDNTQNLVVKPLIPIPVLLISLLAPNISKRRLCQCSYIFHFVLVYPQ